MGGDLTDTGRDMLALVRACGAGHDEGIETILDNADLRQMASMMAGMLYGLMGDFVEAIGAGGPADRAEVVDEGLARMLRRLAEGG